ncbi:MAG: protein phosphatase 2C domain-containing protein [Verrucomicrobiota bacterium]
MRAPPPPLSTSFGLRWSGLTHSGRVRANNEDAFLGLAFDAHEVRHLGKTGEASLAACDFVFAVSDGMGGAKSGEFASRIAIDRITRLLPRRFRRGAAAPTAPVPADGATDFSAVLAELVGAIHHDLLHLGQAYEECAGMGATLSLAWIMPGKMFFAHVGDSRLYHLPHAGALTQLTHDHSEVGRLQRAGRLNEREARAHPRRHILDQVLGGGQDTVEPQLGMVPWQAGDIFLLCTDGVTDGLGDNALAELIRTPVAVRITQPPAQRLVEEAVLLSGRDNATAVVVELG